ncbi:YqaJ viral recombinase family protein [Selenomonas noxia]|jgi:putative phage-type endonuclease|uniref:YqaJ viral recombinase family nuclease n=1 Tax=Selenomonas noxia TaxID=135083 RepID=UPI0028808487|nr:YqaJ viral recombinase family protein [Selenomonas noxia]
MAKLIMSIAEMTDEKKWLEARSTGIGGSDAAVIVGLNRWKSPFQLWLEKTGKAEPDDLSENEYVYWGKVLEEAVAKRFCELTGKKVQRRGLLQMDGCPYIIASVDRMVVGENAGLECKTCNGFAAKEWEDDEVPAAYYVQCQHYMMVTGCERWYIAVLIGGNRFVWKEIPRNDKEIDLLFQAETEFWHKVQEGIMPEVDGSESCKDALVAEFQGGIAEPLTLPGMAVGIIEQIRKIEDAKNDLENNSEFYKNQLRKMMGSYELGYAGDYKVSWKAQAGRTTIDSKALKEKEPEIYAKYAKQGKPTRVLRIS